MVNGMQKWSRGLVAALVLGLAMATGGAAQEATPISTQVAGANAHPAHIHDGTCEQLGDVVAPLSDVSDPSASMDSGTPVGSPIAATLGEMVGAQTASPVQMSVTQLDNMSMDDLTGGQFAINVHQSAENIGEYIACGDVGGMMVGDTLMFGLHELNDSGYHGVALISQDPDGTINVVVYLAHDMDMGM